MPQCVDKIAVRHIVSRTIGEDYLIPLRIASTSWDVIATRIPDGPGVLKCSHDSGSAVLFDVLSKGDIQNLEAKFKRLISLEYGVGKGEWMYRDVPRQFLIEERLPGHRPGVGPADIKIHCVNGQPKLIHVIKGRQQLQEQAFFAPDGARLTLRVKPHRKEITDIRIEPILDLVLGPAQKLSAPFRYVRVDMYVVGGKPYFGELSFNEQSGLFKNRFEEEDLARVLQIDCSGPKKSIHATVVSPVSKRISARSSPKVDNGDRPHPTD